MLKQDGSERPGQSKKQSTQHKVYIAGMPKSYAYQTGLRIRCPHIMHG